MLVNTIYVQCLANPCHPPKFLQASLQTPTGHHHLYVLPAEALECQSPLGQGQECRCPQGPARMLAATPPSHEPAPTPLWVRNVKVALQ
jgi:hypothetical protein